MNGKKRDYLLLLEFTIPQYHDVYSLYTNQNTQHTPRGKNARCKKTALKFVT